jgi:hypothetical protein
LISLDVPGLRDRRFVATLKAFSKMLARKNGLGIFYRPGKTPAVELASGLDV